MATAIGRRVDQRQWQCGWYDWRVQARTLRPSRAVKAGRDVAGPWLGRRIVTLSKNWRHVHLIGHSAGAWVVNAAADVQRHGGCVDGPCARVSAAGQDGDGDEHDAQRSDRSRGNGHLGPSGVMMVRSERLHCVGQSSSPDDLVPSVCERVPNDDPPRAGGAPEPVAEVLAARRGVPDTQPKRDYNVSIVTEVRPKTQGRPCIPGQDPPIGHVMGHRSWPG